MRSCFPFWSAEAMDSTGFAIAFAGMFAWFAVLAYGIRFIL
jgi:hypothetical protein